MNAETFLKAVLLDGALVEDEGKEKGKIAWLIYLDYVYHIGVQSMGSVLGVIVIGRTLMFLAEWWIARWASDNDQDNFRWVWILIVFVGSGTLTNIVGSVSLFSLFIRGSTSLHNFMIVRVMRAPLKFFHTNPTGRILNRFSKDLGVQDDEIAFNGVDLFMVTQFSFLC